MKDMFSIGELASYQNISKQTLIYYDKIGLFKPAYIDPDNKYRYYTVKQVDYLDTILIMKEIGFTLNEIQEHMKNYTIDTSLITMREQLTVIDQQITHLELVRNRLAPPMPTAGTCKDISRTESGSNYQRSTAQISSLGRYRTAPDIPGNQHCNKEMLFPGTKR